MALTTNDAKLTFETSESVTVQPTFGASSDEAAASDSRRCYGPEGVSRVYRAQPTDAAQEDLLRGIYS